MSDCESGRCAWLPSILILGSPWLMAAITIALVVTSQRDNAVIGWNEVGWIARINWLVAAVGSAYGGLSAHGALPTRVAVVIATLVYGAAIYLVLMGVAQASVLRFGL